MNIVNPSSKHEGYFNATELVPIDSATRKRTHKPAHFSDNIKVIRYYGELNKFPFTTKGRHGATWLPLEVEEAFKAWLITTAPLKQEERVVKNPKSKPTKELTPKQKAINEEFPQWA